jgi:tRNA threonylcarbamoyl adenosine modification protein YeaZ
MTWLLALHSSSQVLGVGVRPLEPGGAARQRSAAFPLGRALANDLLACVEQLLPAQEWPRLGRLAVATGPGGFTGTRLTVVLARTLAQQLQLPLDGFSSFLLVARRLGLQQPTWLTQELPRRGVVAGLYGPDPQALGGMAELQAPRLFPAQAALAGTGEGPVPIAPADGQQPDDVIQLLDLSAAAHARGVVAPWQGVLPLYPTSPVAGAPEVG